MNNRLGFEISDELVYQRFVRYGINNHRQVRVIGQVLTATGSQIVNRYNLIAAFKQHFHDM
jgi:hypothetical protein